MSRGVLVVLVVAHIEGHCEHSARTWTAVFRVVLVVAQPVGPYNFPGELFAVAYVALPVLARLKKLRRLHAQLELACHGDYSILPAVDPNLDLACAQECFPMMPQRAVLQFQDWKLEIVVVVSCFAELDVPSLAALF